MRSGSRGPAFYGEIPSMRWGILDDDGGYFYCITYMSQTKAFSPGEGGAQRRMWSLIPAAPARHTPPAGATASSGQGLLIKAARRSACAGARRYCRWQRRQIPCQCRTAHNTTSGCNRDSGRCSPR